LNSWFIQPKMETPAGIHYATPVSSEISDLCKISDLLLFFSSFASQGKQIKSGNYCTFLMCV